MIGYYGMMMANTIREMDKANAEENEFKLIGYLIDYLDLISDWLSEEAEVQEPEVMEDIVKEEIEDLRSMLKDYFIFQLPKVDPVEWVRCMSHAYGLEVSWMDTEL